MTIHIAQKRPIKVDAVHYIDNLDEVLDFIGVKKEDAVTAKNGALFFHDVILEKGNWLIKGIHGEFYALGEKQFHDHYDVVASRWLEDIG